MTETEPDGSPGRRASRLPEDDELFHRIFVALWYQTSRMDPGASRVQARGAARGMARYGLRKTNDAINSNPQSTLSVIAITLTAFCS